MYKNRRITVVIPCLNEKEGIGKVLRELPAFVDEVVVVDNGSTDGTAVVALQLGAHVVTELHRGYGRAYKSGFSRATGDIIVTPVMRIAWSYTLRDCFGITTSFLSPARIGSRCIFSGLPPAMQAAVA